MIVTHTGDRLKAAVVDPHVYHRGVDTVAHRILRPVGRSGRHRLEDDGESGWLALTERRISDRTCRGRRSPVGCTSTRRPYARTAVGARRCGANCDGDGETARFGAL
jgi:hypothetical protein